MQLARFNFAMPCILLLFYMYQILQNTIVVQDDWHSDC